MAKKRKSVKARGKFSDETRATIYAWDRAVCAMTGANLWMLDYGLSGLEQEDWADHVKPAARGGRHEAKNGVCASANANFTKGANGRANEFWFIGGRPTYRYFADLGKVPEATARWLQRDVQPRDWYFNRAVRNLLLAVAADGCDVRGYKRLEDDLYYPRAALRFLSEFREAWTSGPRRGARSHARPSSGTGRRAGSCARAMDGTEGPACAARVEKAEDIRTLAAQLAKRYAKNFAWVEKMDSWTKSCDPPKGQAILAAMSRDQAVSPLVKDLVTHNITVLSGLPKPIRGEGKRDTVRRWDEYE